MIVVDVADEMRSIVVELEGQAEVRDSTGHVLGQHRIARIGIASGLADMPEMRSAEQGIQSGVALIGADGPFQLCFNLRDGIVAVAVIDRPETIDRGSAGLVVALWRPREPHRSE